MHIAVSGCFIKQAHIQKNNIINIDIPFHRTPLQIAATGATRDGSNQSGDRKRRMPSLFKCKTKQKHSGE
jgi:hypothetical protein